MLSGPMSLCTTVLDDLNLSRFRRRANHRPMCCMDVSWVHVARCEINLVPRQNPAEIASGALTGGPFGVCGLCAPGTPERGARPSALFCRHVCARVRACESTRTGWRGGDWPGSPVLFSSKGVAPQWPFWELWAPLFSRGTPLMSHQMMVFSAVLCAEVSGARWREPFTPCSRHHIPSMGTVCLQPFSQKSRTPTVAK